MGKERSLVPIVLSNEMGTLCFAHPTNSGVAEYRYERIIPRSVVGALQCNVPTEFISSFSNARILIW
jgi:hypothetical protein